MFVTDKCDLFASVAPVDGSWRNFDLANRASLLPIVESDCGRRTNAKQRTSKDLFGRVVWTKNSSLLESLEENNLRSRFANTKIASAKTKRKLDYFFLQNEIKIKFNSKIKFQVEFKFLNFEFIQN